MANQIIKARYKTKTDTEANWIKNNPVLLAGEMAISSDKDNKYKVGDGTSKWSALKYAKANLEKSDVTTALGYTPPSKDTTYSTGTASTAGLTKLYTSTGTATDGTMTQAAIKTGLDSKAPSGHTHNYAGSSSAGGPATSAVKLDTTTAGSTTQPVYFSGGKPVATTYTLGKSVPSNAVFTDTNTKVTQTAVASSDYTNWRPLVIGSANSGTEGFTPTTVTDAVLTTQTVSVQPSSGTIKATKFKGSLTGNADTASNASKVNGHTVGIDVPSSAKFTDTNTKVTSVENHYKPSPYNSETLSAQVGTLKDITNSSSGVPVVTGIIKDAAGHVTGFTSVTLKSTNTTYELMSVTEFEALFK